MLDLNGVFRKGGEFTIIAKHNTILQMPVKTFPYLGLILFTQGFVYESLLNQFLI